MQYEAQIGLQPHQHHMLISQGNPNIRGLQLARNGYSCFLETSTITLASPVVGITPSSGLFIAMSLCQRASLCPSSTSWVHLTSGIVWWSSERLGMFQTPTQRAKGRLTLGLAQWARVLSASPWHSPKEGGGCVQVKDALLPESNLLKVLDTI